MKINRFEDIIAWQKSQQLTIKTYGYFKNCKDFSFKDQIQRATVSCMNNIAEGYERQSNNELKHFLYVAKGSVGEVRSMLDLAIEFEYITRSQFDELYGLAEEVSKLLSGFIKTL